MTRATSSSSITASSTGTTSVTTESVGSVWTAARRTAPANGILVASAVWVVSIHRLSKKHSVKRETSTRACGEVGKNSDNGKKMTNDQAFFTGR